MRDEFEELQPRGVQIIALIFSILVAVGVIVALGQAIGAMINGNWNKATAYFLLLILVNMRIKYG